jgi:hypothetical protein
MLTQMSHLVVIVLLLHFVCTLPRGACSIIKNNYIAAAGIWRKLDFMRLKMVTLSVLFLTAAGWSRIALSNGEGRNANAAAGCRKLLGCDMCGKELHTCAEYCIYVQLQDINYFRFII